MKPPSSPQACGLNMTLRNRRSRPQVQIPSNAASRRRSGRRAPARPTGERLEERTLLTAYLVDTFADNNDGNIGPGNLSLREAILLSNANPGADRIDLPAGTYNLSIAGAGEDAGRTGDLDITDSLAIVGAGPASTTIDARSLDRAFHVIGGSSGTNNPVVSLSGLKITGGLTPTASTYVDLGGGAILSINSALSLENCVVQGNATASGSAGGRGGGIGAVSGSVSITGSTITGNKTGSGSTLGSGGHGGGVAGNGTVITVRDSTVSYNTTGNSPNGWAGRGGGLYNESGTPSSPGSLNVINTTVTGNQAGTGSKSGGMGGGIYNYAGSSVFIDRSTIRGNWASYGGGVMTDNGTDGSPTRRSWATTPTAARGVGSRWSPA